MLPYMILDFNIIIMAKKIVKPVEEVKEEKKVETPKEETKEEENKDWKGYIHVKANCNYWSIDKDQEYYISKRFYEDNKSRFDLIK